MIALNIAFETPHSALRRQLTPALHLCRNPRLIITGEGAVAPAEYGSQALSQKGNAMRHRCFSTLVVATLAVLAWSVRPAAAQIPGWDSVRYGGVHGGYGYVWI